MTTRFTSKTKGVWSTVGSGLKQTHSSGQENHIQYGAGVFHTPATKHNHQQHTRAGHHSARLHFCLYWNLYVISRKQKLSLTISSPMKSTTATL